LHSSHDRALVVLSRVLLHPLLVLTTRDDKVVIFTVTPPRARWHVTNFDELPIGDEAGNVIDTHEHKGDFKEP